MPRSSQHSRGRFRQRASGVVLTLALAVGMTGCISSGSGDATTVRYPLASDPTTFSPANARGLDDYSVDRMLYDTLLRRDTNGEIVGGLATDWDVDPHGGTLTIRDGATCSDGTPITAQVVADSLTWMTSKKTRSPFRSQIFGPQNEVSFTATGPATLKISLDKPFADTLYGLTHVSTGIVCPAGIKNPEGLARGTVKGAFSGPFELVSSDQGVSYEFALRKDYDAWPDFHEPLTGAPPERVVTPINANASTISNELLAGGLDVAQVRGLDMTRFENNPSFSLERIPSASAFIQFNEREGTVFADPQKRRAVARAVNREAFNKAVTGGIGQEFASVAQPAVPCANQDPSLLLDEDKDAARRALDGVKVRVLSSQAIGPNGAAGTYVAEALREVGADVQLRQVDNGTWLSDMGTRPDTWDLTIMASINGVGTMNGAFSTFVGLPTEDGGLNSSGKVNQPVMDLVKRAMATTDETERCGILHQAEALLYRDADVVPMSGIVSQITARSGYSMRAPGAYKDEATFRIHESEVR